MCSVRHSPMPSAPSSRAAAASAGVSALARTPQPPDLVSPARHGTQSLERGRRRRHQIGLAQDHAANLVVHRHGDHIALAHLVACDPEQPLPTRRSRSSRHPRRTACPSRERRPPHARSSPRGWSPLRSRGPFRGRRRPRSLRAPAPPTSPASARSIAVAASNTTCPTAAPAHAGRPVAITGCSSRGFTVGRSTCSSRLASTRPTASPLVDHALRRPCPPRFAGRRVGRAYRCGSATCRADRDQR